MSIYKAGGKIPVRRVKFANDTPQRNADFTVETGLLGLEKALDRDARRNPGNREYVVLDEGDGCYSVWGEA